MGKNRICVICFRRESQRSGFFANFPLDENRCKEWVRVIGQEDLVYLPIEKLHTIRFVCDEHFSKKDFNKKGSRLRKSAIPNLKLIAAPLTERQLEGFPLHVAKKRGQNINVQLEPSTSKGEKQLSSTNFPEFISDINIKSSSKQEQQLQSSGLQALTIEMETGPSTSKKEHQLPSTRKQDQQIQLMDLQQVVVDMEIGTSIYEQDISLIGIDVAANVEIGPSVCKEDLSLVETEGIATGAGIKLATSKKEHQLSSTSTQDQQLQLKDLQQVVVDVGIKPSNNVQDLSLIGMEVAAYVEIGPSVCERDISLIEMEGIDAGTDIRSTACKQDLLSTEMKEITPDSTREPLPELPLIEMEGIDIGAAIGPSTSQMLQKTPKKRKTKDSQHFENQKGTKKQKVESNIDLTPRKKKLIAELQKTKCTLASLRKSAKLIEEVKSPILRNLIAADLKNQKRKPKGRRWTLKEKISALAIYKRSPKTYRFLANGLMLPSVKTLHNLLRKIPMDTGINKAVLQHLQNVSSTMNEKNKYCVLLFDEIALKPRLVYNEATDQVDGYEDKGKAVEQGRTDRVADHALVFMLQGLHARYKQLVAYYFVKGTISSQQLAAYIKQLITAINKTSFKVLATVCDQGPTNMGALKLLKENSKIRSDRLPGIVENLNFFITDDDKKIYTMYDIPHLLKSIRNNFMNHGQMQLGNNTGKWLYLYEAEEQNKSLLGLSKLTSKHVRPKYRAKMKVKYAAQVLSKTVSAVLKLLVRGENDQRRANEKMQTALVVEDLDHLFDCTNGPSSQENVKRGQRENVSANTNHPHVWNNFRKKLTNSKFIKRDGTEAKNVKCIQGMQISLRTLQDLWNDVSKLGFQYLNLRSLNQDGLENFFGIIRQHSPTDRNPTCTGFIAALKTSVVSGMTAQHGKGFNCEKDNQPLLTNFEEILEESTQDSDISATKDLNKDLEVGVQTQSPHRTILDDVLPVLNIPEELVIDMETDLADIKFQPLVYVSGYLASTLKINDCVVCRSILIEEDELKQQSEVYQYIQLREWWDKKRSLTYPSLPLCRMLETAVNVFEREIIPRLHERNISALCTTLFLASCDTTWFTCTHANCIINDLFGRLGRLLIRRQCQRINQKFVETEERIKDVTKKAEQGFS